MFQAENPEPLVFGVQYNASSSATFRLIVTDVNETPQFSQQLYQAKVREDVAKGTKVGNVTAKDRSVGTATMDRQILLSHLAPL